jgi:threonine dehydrogenase-like Zn-dependent dehydrogenase
MVLEAFRNPLVMREFGVGTIPDGHVLVRLSAAGVCGSDLHMYQGKDPRTPLPIILGHEGVGHVEAVGGRVTDVDGHELAPGDPIIWDRGIMCGACRMCVIERRPALCASRRAYGIHIGAAEPPHLNGCYATHLMLRPGTRILSLRSRDAQQIDPAILVAASCSGATAAHAAELADIRVGDSVVIYGPGPLGAFLVAFSRARGASRVIVVGGTGLRLEICQMLGATHTINRNETSPDERREMIMDATGGRGARTVFDAAGSHDVVREAIDIVSTGGSVSLPGFAVPSGTMPVDIFGLTRRTISLQGVWVSDARHLDEAFSLVMANQEAFAKMVTHRFPLDRANEALAAVRDREAVKAVLIP